MLQVWGISGEEVASVPVAEMHDVRTLKQSLQKVCGLPRFRQRLLHDGRDLEDVARLEMVQDVQLVLLDFCPVSHHEARHLFKAADGGMVLEVEKALQRPQDPNQTTSPTHPTPLNRAARNGHMEVVHLLLEATADLERYHYHSGCTALGSAAGFGHVEIVRLLLVAGGKVNNGATTALFRAASTGHEEIVGILLEARAAVDVGTRLEGRTALGVASYNGHAKTVALLLQARADTDQACGWEGETALSLAAKQGHHEVVRLMTHEGTPTCGSL
ncbi:mask [Symbiodinium natans]|uniref:Mask protein n=1 Tax=Symbiodinium natans TaxID=878477 RepID=A0A812J154_9DINO|nr:mask [Symbiodinium natans]